MTGQPVPYVVKLVIRTIMLAFAAAGGVTAAGMVLLLPLMVLHSLGAFRYRIEEDAFGLSALFIVGALVGQAHLLDTIIKTERENR